MTTGQLEEKLKSGTSTINDPAEKLKSVADELALSSTLTT